MDYLGDLLSSGDVTNPSAGDVLVDSGALAFGAPDAGLYSLRFFLNSSIDATFELGVYNSDDSADRVIKASVKAGVFSQIAMNAVSVADGKKIKIKSQDSLTAVVQAGLNLQIIGVD